MADLQHRRRRESDRVLSTAVAAAMLEKSRQAIDSGLRAGAIKGFRDPETSRLWVARDWVEQRVPGNRKILSRLSALEEATGLATGPEHRGDAPPVPAGDAASTAVAAQNVTLRSVSLQLLAALEAYDEFTKHTAKAERFEDKARKQRRQATAALQRANASYREALSQTLLPGSPEELDT